MLAGVSLIEKLKGTSFVFLCICIPTALLKVATARSSTDWAHLERKLNELEEREKNAQEELSASVARCHALETANKQLRATVRTEWIV